MEPMFKTVTSLFVAAVVVAVLGVTDASATTFCVPSFHAGCANPLNPRQRRSHPATWKFGVVRKHRAP